MAGEVMRGAEERGTVNGQEGAFALMKGGRGVQLGPLNATRAVNKHAPPWGGPS